MRLSLACLACLLPLSAAAQEAPGFSLGLGVGFSDSPYIGEDDFEADVLPLINFRTERFELGTGGASYDVIQNGPLVVDVFVAPRFSALEDPDSDELDGIDRDLTFDAGAGLGYAIRPGTRVTASVRTEITDEHEGQELRLALFQEVPNFPLRLGAGVSFLSDDLASYLYGVEEDEARAGRPAYDPDALAVPFLSLNSQVPLRNNISLFAGARMAFLPDEATDSPIVEDDVVLSSNVGIAYRF